MNTYWTEATFYLIIHTTFYMLKCKLQRFDIKNKHFNIILSHIIGRYRVTSDIYVLFMQVHT